ncbi:MAG: cytochrome P450 [Chloroflexota bacterium]
MELTHTVSPQELQHPINLSSRHFVDNKFAYYHWLREEAPVYKGKISVLNVYFVSRYDDCVSLLKDPRFARKRETAIGGEDWISKVTPKSVKLLLSGMINQDEPEHRRLRTLVHKAFTPRALKKLETRIESLTHELLDQHDTHTPFDLKQEYALPIPVTMISEMMGVGDDDIHTFQEGVSALVRGADGWGVIPLMLWQLPKLTKLLRRLVVEKRQNPSDDILSHLVHAEENGDQLNDDELVTMAFVLITAGYETTVHLISNAVVTLLQHPEQLAKLQANSDLMPSAIEEIMRFAGSVHGTEMNYASEDITWHGVTIPRGAATIPLLGAANRDPNIFDNPDVFDITRSPNKHLGFGQGIHYCLGAPLARIETQIALRTLFERFPDVHLTDPDALTFSTTPAFHSYEQVPIILR